jgi:hypothetical protein
MRRNFYLMACAVTVLTATLLVGLPLNLTPSPNLL